MSGSKAVTAKKTRALGAERFLPARITLPALRSAAHECRGCALYRNATQTVFGEGPRSARVLLVGEQPGNEEDLQGHPFVGPAGRVLDEALASAGIDRADAYVTNVVKHFKWRARGKRRIHEKPNEVEIQACLPWLEREAALVAPEIVVCLGTTAAKALLGRRFKLSEHRGKLLPLQLAPKVLATVHPSYVLRQRTSADRRRELTALARDLGVVASALDRIAM
jgi:uracil-DNA glycosylase family protein